MEDYFNDTLTNRSILVGPGEGERMETNGLTIEFKVTSDMTGDQLGVYELTLQPQAVGAKLHYHRFMDETFVVTGGELTIQTSDGDETVAAGGAAHFPRFTPHGFRNDSDSVAKCILVFNPAQKREGFFRGLWETLSETPINPEKYLQLYNKYDSFPVDRNQMLPVREA